MSGCACITCRCDLGCRGVRADFLLILNRVERKFYVFSECLLEYGCFGGYKLSKNTSGEVKHSQNIMSLLVHFEYPVVLLA